MNASAFVAVDVLCTLAPCRPLSPFHWALLRALGHFPPGQRPALAEFTHRLRIGEPAFLAQAWQELCAARTTDDSDFALARRSVAGDEALHRGALVVGDALVHRHVLYFRRHDGTPWPTLPAEGAATRALPAPPAWHARLTLAQVAAALAAQARTDRQPVGTQLVAFAIDWSTARAG